VISSSFRWISRYLKGSRPRNWLEPLGPQHNAADYAAWTASIGHIRATPGFAGTGWPHEMSLAENLRDLERHAQDFAERRGFTYTVLSTSTGEVIGCVYIYPPRGDSHGGASAGEHDAAVSSGRGDCPAGRLVRRPRAVPQRFRSLAASSESQCGVDGGTRSRVVRLIGFEDCHHRLCAPRGIPREVPACSEQSRLPHLP